MTTVAIRPMRADDATQVPGRVAVPAVSARAVHAGLAPHHAAGFRTVGPGHARIQRSGAPS